LEIRNLGASGLRVSAIGLGCNNFGGRIGLDATRKVIHKALDLGITLFDTADTYGERGGAETCMGQILGDDRKRIVLATKFGMPMDDEDVKVGGSRRYIMNEVEDSLRRLRTDWIDLYQIHQPDPRTPLEETLRALDDLVHQGKVRYIGCSNFPAWQVMEAQWTAKMCGLHAFVSCQDEYSLVFRKPETELMPASAKSSPAAFAAAEDEIVGHMNADHADAVQLYATRLLGQPAGDWKMTGIDTEGLDLRCGGAVARLAFEPALAAPGDARAALIALVTKARTRGP